MAAKDTIIASAKDGLGRTIVLTQSRWDHIVRGHRQLDGLEMAVMRVVEDADIRRDGNYQGAKVLYKAGLGPAKWLAVVVAYSGIAGQVMTAYPHSKEPKDQ